MSNGAEGIIDDFREGKEKEESPPEAKKTIKLLFEKVGDVCSVDVDGFQVRGFVKEYYIERVGDIERMEIGLEVISE